MGWGQLSRGGGRGAGAECARGSCQAPRALALALAGTLPPPPPFSPVLGWGRGRVVLCVFFLAGCYVGLIKPENKFVLHNKYILFG